MLDSDDDHPTPKSSPSPIAPRYINFMSRSDLDSEVRAPRPDFCYPNNIVANFLNTYHCTSQMSINGSIVKHLKRSLGSNHSKPSIEEYYQTCSLAVRDRLIERWNDGESKLYCNNEKRVYFLSAKYELGKMLKTSLWSTQMEEATQDSFSSLEFTLNEVYERESEVSLCSSNEGKFSYCFLESLSSNNLPGWGYGLRFSFGGFKQAFVGEAQTEFPSYWAGVRSPWEIHRPEKRYRVKFYGRCVKVPQDLGFKRVWVDYQSVLSDAYDFLISGHKTWNVLSLRLWKSIPDPEMLQKAMGPKEQREVRWRAEEITTKYECNSPEIVLKQQYLLVSASLQDIVSRFKKTNEDIKDLPQKVVLQFNDSFPALVSLELLRMLVDEEELELPIAAYIVTKVLSWICYCVSDDQLRLVDAQLFAKVLPRHMDLLEELNAQWMKSIENEVPSSDLPLMSLIAEEEERKVRLGHVAALLCHKLVAVSGSVLRYLSRNSLVNFDRLFPDRFELIPLGVSPRRWIAFTSPELYECLSECLGNALSSSADFNFERIADSLTQEVWPNIFRIKNKIKRDLARYLHKLTGYHVTESAIFDVFSRRFTDLRRPLLLCLYILHRYLQIKEGKNKNFTKLKRTFIIAGRASPESTNAKLTVNLAKSLSRFVQSDPEVSKYLQVIFIINAGHVQEDMLSCAADVTEQLALAGSQAADFPSIAAIMNGAILLGTKDPANIEVARQLDPSGAFLFGPKTYRASQGSASSKYQEDIEMSQNLQEVVNLLLKTNLDADTNFAPLINSLIVRNDDLQIGADFEEYIQAQSQIDAFYLDREAWKKICASNAIRATAFYSDRMIKQYTEKVWKISKKT